MQRDPPVEKPVELSAVDSSCGLNTSDRLIIGITLNGVDMPLDATAPGGVEFCPCDCRPRGEIQRLEFVSAAAHHGACISTKRVRNGRLSVCNSSAWMRPRCSSSKKAARTSDGSPVEN